MEEYLIHPDFDKNRENYKELRKLGSNKSIDKKTIGENLQTANGKHSSHSRASRDFANINFQTVLKQKESNVGTVNTGTNTAQTAEKDIIDFFSSIDDGNNNQNHYWSPVDQNAYYAQMQSNMPMTHSQFYGDAAPQHQPFVGSSTPNTIQANPFSARPQSMYAQPYVQQHEYAAPQMTGGQQSWHGGRDVYGGAANGLIVA